MISSLLPVQDSVNRARLGFRADTRLPVDRHAFLDAAATALLDRKEELARLLAEEVKKPIREARVEVERASITLHWSAEEALRLEGTIHAGGITSQRVAARAYVTPIPLGVVAAITPFNFPFNIPVHKLGPALAAGNAVVLKPSPKAERSAEKLVDLLHRAGVPDDLLVLVEGDVDVVEALSTAEVDAITFTGSTAAGHNIARWGAGKKILLELGGNDPVVVMEDADLDRAAATIVSHRFGYAGQRCTACKRVYVQEPVYERLRGKVLEAVSRLVVGDPLDEKTDVGPVINEAAAETLEAKLASAVASGAWVLCGGHRSGAFFEPTVVENVAPGEALCREETFGPILPLFRFQSFDEVVSLVNGTPYGLQAGIFTNRLDLVREAFRQFDVGTLAVNDGPALRVEPIPFGGVKASGHGREGVRYAVRELMTLKTLLL